MNICTSINICGLLNICASNSPSSQSPKTLVAILGRHNNTQTMNKFRHHLVIILTLSLTSLFGQTGEKQTSFLDNINAVVKDSSSKYFYPKLLNRVKTSGDSITKDDMFYLYYGQLGQAGHKRLSFVANPEMTNFLRNVENGKCKKAIPIGLTILDRSPADLTTLLHMAICVKETQQTDKYFLDTRFRLLLDAIFSTGNGLTKETAVKITNVEDDLVLKGIMRFLGGKESLDTGNNKSYSVWRKGNDTIYFEDLWTY